MRSAGRMRKREAGGKRQVDAEIREQAATGCWLDLWFYHFTVVVVRLWKQRRRIYRGEDDLNTCILM
jgi:hypothetical protein